MTEHTREATSLVLDIMEDLRPEYGITFRIEKNGFAAAYLNKLTPYGKTTEKQITWGTGTAAEKQQFVDALIQACLEVGALVHPVEWEGRE